MQITMQETGSNSNGNQLSIRFSADGFYFCSGSNSKSVKFDKTDKSFRRSMAVCLCESDIWESHASVKILIDDDITSFIPSSIFSDAECQDIMKFSYPGLDFSKCNMHTDYLEGFDISNVYAINGEIDKFIEENFPYAETTHIFSLLVQEALRSSRSNDNRELWLNISGSTMYAAVTKGGTLLMANRYPISSAGDVLYWTGSIYNHYNLSQQTVPLWISGDNRYTEALKERISVCNTLSI